MSDEESGERRRTTDNLLEQFDRRLTRFEEKIDERFDRLEAKSEARAQWEKGIELRLAALEGVNRIVTWVTATIAVLVIAGALTFFWALLANRIDIVEHNPTPAASIVIVTATPHP